MKTFTYVAAIALLTAGTAFAQSSGMNSSSTSTMQQPAQSQSMSNQNMSGSSMSRDTNQSSNSASAPRHIARNHAGAGNNARENRETAELNMRQVQGGMSNAGTSGTMGASSEMGGQTAQTPFDRGSPQTPRAGIINCTPDRPDCGTARQNPAIQSSPQQRIYNAAPQ